MQRLISNQTILRSIRPYFPLLQIVGPVMQHVSQLVHTGNERLSDHGSDRTYNIFQCLVNTNLPRIIAHGPDPQAMLLQVCFPG
jgi:hypothetical protein